MRAAVLVAAIGVGCGGGQRLPPRASAPATPVDAATLRALLQRYSPSGHAIVAAYEALPDPAPASPSQGFDDYVRDAVTNTVVTKIVTGVHEITHGYTGRMAFKLLADRKLPMAAAHVILADKEPWLVHLTPTFPSIEMDATFPADARTNRYGIYIDTPDEPNLATQSLGIHGLVDEYSASYQDARTTLDFWPYVRDEAPADATLINNYAVLIDDLQRAFAEFQLYILHYLVHAREHRPEVYASLLASEPFRRSLIEVHDAYAGVAAAAAALEPTVFAFARTRGVALERRDGQLSIDGNPQRSNEAAADRALRAHLGGEVYRSMLAALRQ